MIKRTSSHQPVEATPFVWVSSYQLFNRIQNPSASAFQLTAAALESIDKNDTRVAINSWAWNTIKHQLNNCYQQADSIDNHLSFKETHETLIKRRKIQIECEEKILWIESFDRLLSFVTRFKYSRGLRKANQLWKGSNKTVQNRTASRLSFMLTVFLWLEITRVNSFSHSFPFQRLIDLFCI